MDLNFKKQIDDIWSDKAYADLEETKIPPFSPLFAKKNALLIIGLNPSLSEEDKKTFSRNPNKEWQPYDQHEDEKKNHRYFRRFPNLANGTGLEWTHIDLLFFRKTSSDNAKWLWNNCKDFITKQLELSIDWIIETDPKVIVVNNAFASDMIKEYATTRYEILDFDDKKGVHYFCYNGKNVPIFFSRMIEGPSPMDNGSFQRLNWHIRFVLNKI
jgi:hypothetical protein